MTSITPDLQAFVARAHAVRVLCRLAKLREDEEYRDASVSAGATDYAGDARRQADVLAPLYREFGADAAVYGLAISDLRSI